MVQSARFAGCLAKGARLFNEGRYFEAHEAWEEGWRVEQGDERTLLHGLIQLAAALHKLGQGVPGGAATLLDRATSKLERVRDRVWCVDVGALLADVRACRSSPPRSEAPQIVLRGAPSNGT